MSTKQFIQRVAVVMASALIIVSLYQSSTASSSAKDLARKNAGLILQVQGLAKTVKAQQMRRQIGVCKSSADLRVLLNDIGTELQRLTASAANPHILDRLVKRIHQYTDTNPNCKGITLPPVT